MENQEEAINAVETAKSFLKKKDYREARTWMKMALEIFPELPNGLEMLIVCETLYYGHTELFPDWGADFYCLLHLHPSATRKEINTQGNILTSHINRIFRLNFPGVIDCYPLLFKSTCQLHSFTYRPDYDCRRAKSGLIDSTEPDSSRKTSFREDYLAWIPPTFCPVSVSASESELANKEKAIDAVDKAKNFLIKKDYREARASIKMAIELFPELNNGLEMLIVCETLYYNEIEFPDWGVDYYSILHIHPSATDKEVSAQLDNLELHLKHMGRLEFPSTSDASDIIEQTSNVLSFSEVRLDYDHRREKSGLIDSPDSSRKTSFREDYFLWKPPTFGSHVAEHFLSKRSLSACDEDDDSYFYMQLKQLKDTVFNETPKHPHFAPLQKYSSNVGEGMMLGLNAAFVNLCEEIQKLEEDPQNFLSRLDGFKEQLMDFEETGYTVDKLRVRLDALKITVERDRLSQDAVPNSESEIQDAVTNFESEVIEREKKIAQLKSEIKILRRFVRLNFSKESELASTEKERA